ncbi:hypothetical protein V1511DRAFT_504099 [Dipodascopsis uninucleata]
MLYELVGIARVNSMREVRDIVRTMGLVIIRTGGVVRRMDWLGEQYLPSVIGKHQQLHIAGHHFSILFDSSPKVQNDVYKLLKIDPRMLRVSMFNAGKSLKDLSKFRGKPPLL